MTSPVNRFLLFALLIPSFLAGCTPSDTAGTGEGEDDQPLRVTILEGPEEITSSDTAEFLLECNRPECTFRCQLNDGTERACQEDVRYENLVDGPYLFTVRAIAGEETSEPSTWEWTVDEEPRVINLEGPDSFTASTAATFTFDCSKDSCTFACRYGDEDFSSCQSGETITGLTSGEHRFEVRARTALGTVGPPRAYTWQVATEAPLVENLLGPASPTNGTLATFTFECSTSPCEYQCRFNDRPSEDCISGYQIPNIEDGTHTFGVRATDRLGRTSVEARWNWTVDTVAPELLNLVGPEGPTNEDRATFTFQCSKDDCTFFCSISSDDFSTEGECLSGYTEQNLPDGAYTFSVRAEDPAGNSSPVQTLQWSIDTEVPIVVNLTGPEELTNQTTASFTFGCSKTDCSFECTLAGPSQAGTIACNAQGASITALQDGDYEFTVLVTDSVGNQSSSSHTWEIDTVVPEVSITNGPDLFSNQDSPSFTFQCSKSPCQFQCTLSGQSGSLISRACDSNDSFPGLADDTYTLTVIGQDAAGNQGSDTFEWTVKTTPPVIEFTTLPSATSDRILSTIEFECLGEPCSFDCALNYLDLDGNLVEGDFESCPSLIEIFTKTEGDYTLIVQATDLAGNLNQSSHTWSVQLTGFIDISIGREHHCGISVDSTLWCWGFNDYGQLGLGDTTSRTEPTQVLANDPELATGWTQVSVGNQRSCALREDTTTWCWGRNSSSSSDNGILGTGATGFDVRTPQQVARDTALETGWAFISSSNESTCGIRENGTLWCWGSNSQGQLGIGGSPAFTTAPQRVGSASDWTHLSRRTQSSCGIREGGSLWCWGSNFAGQLGVEDTSVKEVPTRVGTSQGLLTGWRDVTVGIGITCGIREDSTLWCWGFNAGGALGDGTTVNRSIPTLVGEDTNNSDGWKSVAPGMDHTCAIKEDHTAWCWGATGYLLAQGIDDINLRETNPVPITPGGALPNDWYSIQSADANSCARQHDLSYFCWGGALLVPGTSTQPVPLRIAFP